MSQTQVLEQPVVQVGDNASPAQRRRILNAFWQPFLQFKLLMYMLGSTALVAVLLGGFLYYSFSDLIGALTNQSDATSYYGEMIEIQLVHLFRYCGALFVLYILLLAAVCVAYTHRLIGPLRPFSRHVETLTSGDYSSRVTLRKGDLDIYVEYADKLNELASNLQDLSKAPVAEASTDAPESKAPEAKATDAEATETKTPEAKEPESTASDAEATETKATEAEPTKSEAPEISASEAKEPESEVSNAEVTEAEATDVEAPEAEAEATEAVPETDSAKAESPDNSTKKDGDDKT